MSAILVGSFVVVFVILGVVCSGATVLLLRSKVEVGQDEVIVKGLRARRFHRNEVQEFAVRSRQAGEAGLLPVSQLVVVLKSGAEVKTEVIFFGVNRHRATVIAENLNQSLG